VSNATYVQVTIDFTNVGGANNVSFQLWDIDSTVTGGNNFIDAITNVQAIAVGGGTVYPDTVSNAHTTNPGTQYSTITGSAASLVIAGDPAVRLTNDPPQMGPQDCNPMRNSSETPSLA